MDHPCFPYISAIDQILTTTVHSLRERTTFEYKLPGQLSITIPYDFSNIEMDGYQLFISDRKIWLRTALVDIPELEERGRFYYRSDTGPDKEELHYNSLSTVYLKVPGNEWIILPEPLEGLYLTTAKDSNREVILQHGSYDLVAWLFDGKRKWDIFDLRNLLCHGRYDIIDRLQLEKGVEITKEDVDKFICLLSSIRDGRSSLSLSDWKIGFTYLLDHAPEAVRVWMKIPDVSGDIAAVYFFGILYQIECRDLPRERIRLVVGRRMVEVYSNVRDGLEVVRKYLDFPDKRILWSEDPYDVLSVQRSGGMTKSVRNA